MPKLPSSADVPTVSPRVATDPGVRAPVEAFESSIGIAAQEFAPALGKLAEVAQRRENRRDTVDRSSNINAKNQENEDTLTEADNSGDLSNEPFLDSFIKSVTDATQKRLDTHRATGASEDSVATLTQRLQDLDGVIIARANAKSVKIGRQKVLDTFDDRLKPLLDSVNRNPSPENVQLNTLALRTLNEDLKGAFDPGEERILERSGQELLALQAIDSLLLKDKIEEAEDPRFNSMLSADTLQKTKGRIDRAFFNRAEAQREVQTAEQLAAAKERGKLTARREGIAQILSQVGADPLPTELDGQEGAAVVSPFGPIETSEDAQTVSRMFLGARRLLAAGETQMASGLLAQAKFIIQNSPDIQKQQELEKPIDASLASELGVPLGTTLRTVMGRLPRSPEEVAESRAAATARGRGMVAGQEQISFIDDAEQVLGDLLDEVKTDPGIVGIRGTLRATGQTAIGVLSDLGMDTLVEKARDIAFSESDLPLDQVTALFESPTLSVLGTIENSVGLILARLRTPTGRVPVEVIRISIADVRLSGVTSSKQVTNRLGFIRNLLQRRRTAIEQRFGFQQLQAPMEKLPRFRVTEDGQLESAD